MSGEQKVRAWIEPAMIPTYEPAEPDRNPMFLHRRVYQGSTGKVYPLPFIDRISTEKTPHTWQAVYLENEFLKVMILPEIGGRIHAILDKTNGYDAIYRQEVIKPALVGLAGPWISGGIEFNWPQHHRPSTFMPADVSIEEHDDGSVTVWLGEHEPMNRMKGMHGVCLHPGRSYVEVKARLYNRTPLTQTFLWWANVATKVHELYQSFFPSDVYCVADHAKRAISAYPLCRDRYYGVDYGGRSKDGVTAEELPRKFQPPAGRYDPSDLSWYANIPVPTSYMCLGSRQDFFGGYDHVAHAGIIHIANHHISPGKKQWTWGNHEFGYAWDKNLSDDEAPYIEIMAGIYTDNQPDFSFLMPGETKTFSQYWYPFQKIGPATAANLNAAMSLVVHDRQVTLGMACPSRLESAVAILHANGKEIWKRTLHLAPDHPAIETFDLPAGVTKEQLQFTLVSDGRILLAYDANETQSHELPEPATEPPAPSEVKSIDELFIIGTHLQQYRHATRSPEPYWEEALRRDPLDSRCNTALGKLCLYRGQWSQAEEHFRKAIRRLTSRNPNPYDGEAHYHLGLTLQYQDKISEAYDALYKATWNYAWQSAAFLALAELDCRAARWQKALEHLDHSLVVNAEQLRARDLKALVLRKLSRDAEVENYLRQTCTLDRLDFFARWLLGEKLTCDTQVRLDLALDLNRAGFTAEAVELLASAKPELRSGTAPLVQYYRGYFAKRMGNHAEANRYFIAAARENPEYCFPSRLEEINILETAMAINPSDALAPYYLGNLLYDRQRWTDAVAMWERAVGLTPSPGTPGEGGGEGNFLSKHQDALALTLSRSTGRGDKDNPALATAWRNLGIGYFNVNKDPRKALAAYDTARIAAPQDARIFFERDQLRKRLGISPQDRLAEFEKHLDLVRTRDDLVVELCALYNLSNRPADALEILSARHFQPWEGGEGEAISQYVRAHLTLGREAMQRDDPAAAQIHFTQALTPPPNLGEAKHLLANQSDVHYWLGIAAGAAGDLETSRRYLALAANFRGDFQNMSVRVFSEMTCFSAMAMQKLGRADEAKALLRNLLSYANDLAAAPAKIDYFATSLPTVLLFDDDLQERNRTAAMFLMGQAHLGLGKFPEARRFFEEVQSRDPSHALVGEFLQIGCIQ